MRRLALVLTVCALAATPALAVPTIQFAQDTGGWAYDGAGTLSFAPIIDITKGMGSETDALVGAEIVLPSLTVAGSAGSYTVTPIGPGTITIRSQDATPLTYFTGTLQSGIMGTLGTTASVYFDIAPDITPYSVTAAGLALGSAALDNIAANPSSTLDFNITLQWDDNFEPMFDKGGTGSNGLSGQITVPAPGAVLLGSLGAGLVGWMRRRRSL